MSKYITWLQLTRKYHRIILIIIYCGSNACNKYKWIEYVIRLQYNIICHMTTTAINISYDYNCKNISYLQWWKYTICNNCINISYDNYYTSTSDGYNWIKYIICLQLYKYIKWLQLYKYNIWSQLIIIYHDYNYNQYIIWFQ